MKLKSSKTLLPIFGFAIGVINGLFGAGGGMLAVPLLKHFDCDQKASHANSVAIILPLCVASTILYSISGKIDFVSALYFVPAGIVGAFLGTYLLKHLPDKWLKRIFALFMLWAGMRLLLK